MSQLNDVVVVSLDVRIWSGRRKLRPEDLTASGKLPPKDLVSLGSKKIYDPKALKPFAELKRRAETLCQSIGIRFARAYAVPKAELKAVVENLNVLSEKFNQARDAFLSTYDEELTRWKQQHPGYERLIETELLPKTVVGTKFAFGYDMFAINAVEGDAELAQLLEKGGAGSLTLGLVGTLYQDVASEARAFVKASLVGRHEVTQKFLRPVRAIRDKLAGLSFLDPAITPLVASIDDVLLAVPKKGKISGTSLAALRGVVTLLTDPGEMRSHGQLILEGREKGLLGEAAPDQGEIAIEVLPVEEIAQPAVESGEPRPPEPSRARRVSAFW